jgi:hypothetical protein
MSGRQDRDQSPTPVSLLANGELVAKSSSAPAKPQQRLVADPIVSSGDLCMIKAA